MKKYLYVIGITCFIIIIGVCIYIANRNNSHLNISDEPKTQSNIINTIQKDELNNTNEYVEELSTQIENTTRENIKQNVEETPIVKEKQEKVETNKSNKEVQTTKEPQATETKEDVKETPEEPIIQTPQDTIKEEPIKEETSKVPETEQTQKTEEENIDIQETTQLDFSKYDRYYPALNGGYTCFKKNTEEIAKLKGLIEDAIEEFGYTNVKIVEDSSIISDRYFTANKTNVQNLVYNTEYCTIHYYAETEYTLSKDGVEKVFQLRSYAKLTAQ